MDGSLADGAGQRARGPPDHALPGYPWGGEFRCSEVVDAGSGPVGAAIAGLAAGGIGLFTAAMSFGPTRSALRQFVFPDPGEGPTSKQIENGHFTVGVLGTGEAADGPFTVEAEFGADLDPGYGGTARMFGEAGMCLVRGAVDSPLSGGVLTPASGIGTPLADRLRDVGFTAIVGEASGNPR